MAVFTDSGEGRRLFECALMGWIFVVLMVLTLIFTITALVKFYKSSGSFSEKIKSARRTLIFAVITLALALLDRNFPWIYGTLFLSPYGGYLCRSPLVD